jgi:hypothetical protein
MVADEENRIRKFEQGLNPWIHDRVVYFEIQDFVELVNKASLAKDSVKRIAMAMVDSKKGWHLHRIKTKPNGNEDRMEIIRE